jgi:hypothetical protein
MIMLEINNMKTQVYDRFGGGLLVLIMLTIAFVAGQADANLRDRLLAGNGFQPDAAQFVETDSKRLARIELLSSDFETVFHVLIKEVPGTDAPPAIAFEMPVSENSLAHQ